MNPAMIKISWKRMAFRMNANIVRILASRLNSDQFGPSIFRCPMVQSLQTPQTVFGHGCGDRSIDLVDAIEGLAIQDQVGRLQ